MDKFTKIIVMFIVAFFGTACVSTSADTKKPKNKIIDQFVSGIEINTGSIPLQTLDDSFEADPDGGPILNQKVELFELGDGECLSLVTLYNESGFGGYEDLLIFKRDRILVSLQRNLLFSKENGEVAKSDVKYDHNIDDSENTKSILKEDFYRYKIKFNTKVKSTCI